MPYISYIVPVYNLKTEELSNCIDSIINQTYSDYEIIIVDDGSTNGIERYCDELSQKGKISVIHQVNQGLASARNTGMNAANGEWIVHVDGDDWIDRRLSECLIKHSQKSDADIIVWGFIVSTGSRKQELLLKNKHIFDESYEFIKEDVICSVLGGNDRFSSICLNTSWAKAYKHGFIKRNNLYYDVGLRRAQDAVYNLYAFEKARSISYIDMPLSVYRNDNESLSRGYNLKNIDYLTSTANAVKRFVQDCNQSRKVEEASNMFIQRCFRMINELTILNKKNDHSYIEKKRQFKTIINQDPYLTAFKCGPKRTDLIGRISDFLYVHQLFGCILLFNRLLSLLYRLKHQK